MKEDELILNKWIDKTDQEKDRFYEAMDSADYAYINPSCNDIDILEEQWARFIGTPKRYRRKSDWVMLEHLGCTNETIYNILKSKLIGSEHTDIATPEDFLDEAAYIPASDNINAEEIVNEKINSPSYQRLVQEAIDWMKDTGYILILPDPTEDTDVELEHQWDAYNLMTKKHRRVADWKSLELFNLTVQQAYQYRKSHNNAHSHMDDVSPESFMDECHFSETAFLKRYYGDIIKTESAGEIADSMIKALAPYDHYHESITDGIINAAIDDYDAGSVSSIEVDYADLPMYTPQEMIDMGVFNHVPEDNFFDATGDILLSGDEVLEWFNLYTEVFYGMPITDRYKELNRKRVQKLEEIYTAPSDKFNKASFKQGVLEMGWNSDIPFNPITRQRADDLINEKINSNFGCSKVIDLCGFREAEFSNYAINEDGLASALQPIFLVFEEGTSTFSAAIKAFTNGVYSHAGLAFDPDMHKIYSYGVDEGTGMKGGFIVEDIRKKEPENRFGIFAAFVDSETYQKIRENVNYFITHAKETAYSYANILTILFKVPMEKTNDLICSQFVDKMLKFGGLDLTHKTSSLVDPNYLQRSSKANKNIYKVFEGKTKSFHPSIIIKRLAMFAKRAKNAKLAESYSPHYYTLRDQLLVTYSPITRDTLSKVYNTFYDSINESEAIIDLRGNDFINKPLSQWITETYTLLDNYPYAKDKASAKQKLAENRLVISRQMRYNISESRLQKCNECLSRINKLIGET